MRRFLLAAVLAGAAIWAGSPAAATAAPTGLPSVRPVAPHRLGALKAKAERRYQRLSRGAQQRKKHSHRHGPVQAGLNWRGLSAADNSSANDGSPSDSTGAIGPTRYVEFVNSKIGVYDRSNGQLLNAADAETFAGTPGHNVFDIQIQYDPVSGHWFYSAADIDSSNNAGLVFGWSKSTDPTDLGPGNWCRFFQSDDTGGAPLGSFLDDYPHLGHSDTTVVIGTNVFDNTSLAGPFLTARIWSYPKPTNFGNCPASAAALGLKFTGNPNDPAHPLLTADGDTLSTPMPVNLSDSSPSAYVVASDDPTTVSGAHQIDVLALPNPNPANMTNLGNVDVGSSYDVPASATQQGSVLPLDTLEAQLTQAVGHADPSANGAEAIWTQHTVSGPGGRSAVRWYEILPSGPSIRQQGQISDPANFDFNAAISPTMAGNSAAIQYNVSGDSQIPQVRAQSRDAATALGQMTGETNVANSDAAFAEFTCVPPDGPPCRWGDYAAASPDPAVSNQVWGTTQLAGQPDLTLDPAWLTQNFALVVPAPPDTKAPKVKLAFKRQKEHRALRRGLSGKVSCDEPCTLVLQGAGKATRRKKLKLTKADKQVPVRLRLTSRSKRKLLHRGRLTPRIKATATDAAGNTGTASKRVKIR